MVFSGNGASRILDPAGRPYQRDRYDEFAIPHVMTGQWIYKSGWQTYWHRWDEAVKKNREDALAMRRDAWLMALLQERRLAVASLKWHIEVDNEKDLHEKALKDGLTKILKNTPRLQSLFYYLDDAIWYGRYGSQLHYAWQNMDLPAPAPGPSLPGQPAVKSAQNQKRRALCIQRGLGHPGHIPINGDKIGHKLDHTPYILVHGGQDDQLPQPPAPIWTTEAKAMPLEGWLRDRFIIHAHEFTDADFLEAEMAEGVHGVGIRTFIYFLDWLKKEWLSNISDFMERAGLGVRLWYYQGGNDDARAKIEQVAKDNVRRINILIPRYPGDRGQAQDTMEWRDVPTGGAEFLLEMIKWIEEGIERYIIGQTLSSNTEGSGLGGTGVASMHAETKHRIIAFDANNLADTLTQDWVRVVQHWTYPEYREVPARFVFDVDNPDSEKVLNAVKTFIDMGGEVPEEPIRGLIGIPAPDEGDRVLSAQKMQEAMGQGQNQLLQPGQEPEEEEPWAKDEPKQFGRDAIHYAAQHAPAGGVTIQGKKYEGGEFIPGDVMERATEEEKKAVRGDGEESGKTKEKEPEKPKPLELTGHSPLKKIQSLYEGFKDFSYQDITAAVEEIVGSLPAQDAKELAKDFDISRPLSSKAKVIEEIARKIKGRKESWERTQFREEEPHGELEEPEQLAREPGLQYGFEESKHPRGQPENPGQFAPKDSGSQKGDGKFAGKSGEEGEVEKQEPAKPETRPEPETEPPTQTDPDTIAAEVQGKTANVLTKLGSAGKWLKAQTKAIYDRLENRYGRKTAIAIFAAGHVVGLATPLVILPGSTLIGMAPFAALAETYLQAKRGLKALTDRPTNYDREGELSNEEINELAADVVREILTGWETHQKENPDQYSRFDQPSATDLHALIERLRKVGPVHRWTGAYRELAEVLQRFPDLRRQLPAQDVIFLRMSFGE